MSSLVLDRAVEPAHDSVVDLDEAIAQVAHVVGSDDPRVARLQSFRAQ